MSEVGSQDGHEQFHWLISHVVLHTQAHSTDQNRAGRRRCCYRRKGGEEEVG
jgi:hypothetical protein